jgi:predicted AlkP superfamily phosphohydrolase/phosphomutase
VRLVVVDGADWRVVRPLIEAGRLPHLAGLMERGVSAELGVTFPSESPHMWTALSTGVEDAVNGLCEFYAYRPPGTRALITRYPGLGDSRRLLFRQGILWLHRFGLGSVHFATSAQKAVPELWDYLGDAGKTVAVVGWRFTAPAKPVRGFLLTDEFAPGEAQGGALFPVESAGLVAADDAAEVEALLASFGDFAPRDAAEARRVELHLDGLRLNLERDLLYARTAQRLLDELEPDFLAVAHRAVDGLEHKNMLKHALARRAAGTPLPRHLEGALPAIERGADVVTRAYEIFDQELGLLLEGLGEDVVLVVSDHGHDFDSSGHQFGPPGIIVIAGGPIARGAELDSPTVFDVCPSVLHLMGLPVPEGLAGRVLEEALDPAWAGANPVVHVTPGAGRRADAPLGLPDAPPPCADRPRAGRGAARARLRGVSARPRYR